MNLNYWKSYCDKSPKITDVNDVIILKNDLIPSEYTKFCDYDLQRLMPIKKTVKEILVAYDRQIKKDMNFWIKYRPSCWGDLLPKKFTRPFLKFIKTKVGKKFVLISALIFSIIFVGVIPTLNFIWSNIFRIWWILLVIPLVYWTLAITSVYSRVLVQGVFEFSRAVLRELKWNAFHYSP